MTLSYPYPYKDLCYRDLSNKRYIGILLGRFPGRYTRPKTGIFSRSQYELSHLQNFVLRHIGGIAPRLSRDCPISRRPLTFTHGEISQKFFPIFSQVAQHSPAEFAPFRRNPQNPPKPRLCPKPRKTPQNPVYVTSHRNFSKKFFPKFFPKILRPSGACVLSEMPLSEMPLNALFVGSREIFRKIFFPKIFGILYKISTPRQLDREDFVSLRFHYD